MKTYKSILFLLCVALFNPSLADAKVKDQNADQTNNDDLENKTPKYFFGYINLAGTVMFPEGDQRLNKAVFTDEFSKKRFTYTEGSLMPYGVVVKKIEENKVVLEKEGQVMTLALGEKIGYSADIKSLKNNGYRKLSDNEWAVNSHYLFTSNYDMIKMAVNSGLTMNKGVRITRPVKKLTGLGLERGDKITDINGVSLDGLFDLVTAYKLMKKSENITINILRDGEEVTYNYWVIKKGKTRYSMKQVLASDEIKKLLSL